MDFWCGGCCRLSRCSWSPSSSAWSSGGLPAASCRASINLARLRGSRAKDHLVKNHIAGMMYSPGPIDGGREADIEHLEERLAELEKLVEDLESVPDSGVVGVLDRAVALLEEVNARIEAGLLSAEGEARE